MDVLVVDDSKVMRAIVQRAIRGAGFRGLNVAEASNGVEALNILTNETPKVVLSDWNMPEMLGIELLNSLRARNNSVPFGFVTSEASSEIRELAKSCGAQFLITKPFEPEAFRDALEPIFG